jgi:radical SAM superfamily enzyme YgiQ (UPF0313 family)
LNILLIYPRFQYPVFGELQEPLGILSVAASLRAAGFLVELCDLTLAGSLEALDAPLSRAEAVGLSSTTVLFGRALMVLERIRTLRPELPAALGGPHATACPEESLVKGFDALVIGEGEVTAKELFARLAEKGDPAGIPGVAVLREGNVRCGPPRPFIADLDSLPFPARDLIDYEGYKRNNLIHIGMFVSRGCPFRCSFCKPMQDVLFGKKVRSRSPESVVREMAEAQARIGPRPFLFRDDTLTMLGIPWFEELGSAMARAGLAGCHWSCQSRVDLITSELLTVMKQAGCQGIAFGVESGSQRVLDFYQKKIKVDDTIRAFDLCREFGIGTHAFMMLGAPIETREDVEATLALVRRIKPNSISTSFTTPAPGSQLYLDLTAGGPSPYASYEDVDYLMNSVPLVHPHLSREELVAAQQALVDLVPTTFHPEALRAQRQRWQKPLRT